MTKRKSSLAAFTLIEMLVVIGISTVVSAAAIVYSTSGQNEVALTVETAKIAQLILQARELALDTYSGTSGACAYGVHFDLKGNPQTYSLFAYVPGTKHCPAASSVASSSISSAVMGSYASSSWQLQVPKALALFAQGDANMPASCKNLITDILFYPPSPTTLIAIAGTNGTFSSPSPSVSTVCLRTTNGNNTATITVNPEGQVSF